MKAFGHEGSELFHLDLQTGFDTVEKDGDDFTDEAFVAGFLEPEDLPGAVPGELHVSRVWTMVPGAPELDETRAYQASSRLSGEKTDERKEPLKSTGGG